MGDLYQNSGTSGLLSAEIARGWTLYTWIPVLASALGGIIVGLVTKYAGGVTKGFALIAGLLVTAVTGYVVDGTPLGPRHFVALAMVSMSIVIYNKFPVRNVIPPSESKKNI